MPRPVRSPASPVSDAAPQRVFMHVYGRAIQWLAWALLLLLIVQLLRSLPIPVKLLLHLFMGEQAIQQHSMAEMLGQNIGTVLTAMVIAAVATTLLVHGRRVVARAQLASHEAAGHAPVVYLRSFAQDTTLARRPMAFGRLFAIRTEEEQLAAALGEVGPVVAIGRPGEALPRLGARRVYLADDAWQPQVLDWFGRAALVVIQCPAVASEGVAWEVERALEQVPPQRLAFLLPRGSQARTWLDGRLRAQGWPALPAAQVAAAPYGTPLAAVLHFGPGRQAREQPMAKPPFWRRPYAMPMRAVYRQAFEPVAREIGRVLPRAALGLGDAGVAAFGLALVASAAALAADIRTQLTPMVSAQIAARNSIIRHPAVPPELRREGSVRAFFEWAGPRIRQGMARVPDALVLAQLERYRAALGVAQVVECAALARGGEQHDRHFTALLERAAGRDGQLLRDWMAARMAMLRAELDAAPAIGQLELSTLQASYAGLLQRMKPAERARFEALSGRVAQAGDDDACWYAMQMIDGVRALPGASRAPLARLMLEQPPPR